MHGSTAVALTAIGISSTLQQVGEGFGLLVADGLEQQGGALLGAIDVGTIP
jgi:hypothetical protein